MLNQQENNLINLLGSTKKILDRHNIEFWLDCGTLLGAIRDGKFIPWEYDIDLGVWDDEFSRETRISVSRELFSKGFKVWMDGNHMNIKKEASFFLDINFYRAMGNNAIKPTLYPKNLIGKFLCILLPILSAPYHCSTSRIKSLIKRFVMRFLISISKAIPSFLRKRIASILFALYKKIGSKDVSWKVPSNYFRNLATIKFYGMEFNVPAKTEEYLSYRYGNDWRISKKDWVTEEDDGAVIKPLS